MPKNNSVVENICSFSTKVLPCTFFPLVFYAVAENTYSPCSLSSKLRSSKVQSYNYYLLTKMRCFWDNEFFFFFLLCVPWKKMSLFHWIPFWGKVDWAQGGKLGGREKWVFKKTLTDRKWWGANRKWNFSMFIQQPGCHSLLINTLF